jgi:cobalamin biosynthesis protein CbiG
MSTGNKTAVSGQRSAVRKDRKRDAPAAIFYITDNGLKSAEKIKILYPDAEVLKFSLDTFADRWRTSKNIICIMATGIVVRASAPLLKDKRTDPAVVVLDEKGSFVISLLSGHMGGANELAGNIAGHLGAQPVITTASDVQGRLAPDVWAMEHGLYIEDFKRLKRLSSDIVNGKAVRVYSEYRFQSGRVPDEFRMVDSPQDADLIVSHRTVDADALFLRPGNLFAGIGCNRNTGRDEIEGFINDVFHREGLSLHSIGGLASIDLKNDEKGLHDFAREHELSIDFFSKEELNAAVLMHNIAESGAVKSATGAAAVAEPAAILCAGRMSDKVGLIIPKVKRGNVTLAVAMAEYTL